MYKEILQVFESLKKKDVTNIKDNSDFQIRKLIRVLDISFNNIPHHKGLKSIIDLDNFSYKDFLEVPLMTKEIIRTKGHDLINRNYKNVKGVIKNTSGGSTGEPVEFYRTKNQWAHGMANYYYALHLNNVNIYDKSRDLWGAERDMYRSDTRFDLRSFVQNKVTLNTFLLSDDIIEGYIERLNAFKPKFIKAYVHSIYDISKYINRNNISIEFRPVIHCTTGPLYPEMRQEIKTAFNNAHVYNYYGSREVSAIASENLQSEGMSVLFDNVFVEVLDSSGRPVNKGEEGDVVVTTLNNFYMPLIRYKIGDRAIKGDDLLFGTLNLSTVVGRTLGVIYRKDGSKLDGQFFTTLFFGKKGIKNFQLVQKTQDRIILNIVKSELYNDNELDQILNRIESAVPDVEIDVVFCEKIDLTATGKIMYVYSEIEM